jgi:elongation factor 2
LANPILLEPVFLVEIQVPEQVMKGVHGVISRRRGHIFSEDQLLGTPLFIIKAYLPIMESFGYSDELRAATNGQAFPQSIFDHWEVLPGGSPFEPTTRVGKVVQDIRKRKGIKIDIPGYEHVGL